MTFRRDIFLAEFDSRSPSFSVRMGVVPNVTRSFVSVAGLAL